MAAAATFSLFASSAAEVTPGTIYPVTYAPGGKSNLAMYWVGFFSVVEVILLIFWAGSWYQ